MSTTTTAIVSGPGGSNTCSAGITVLPSPTCSITATPTSQTLNGSATLNFSVTPSAGYDGEISGGDSVTNLYISNNFNSAQPGSASLGCAQFHTGACYSGSASSGSLTTAGTYQFVLTGTDATVGANFSCTTDSTNSDVVVSSPLPTITSISPTSGPTAGGTSVTINGSGFTGATAVKFGATAATGVTVVSDIKITATSPAGSGVVDVTVTTPNGTSATGASDKFTYTSAPATPTITWKVNGTSVSNQALSASIAPFSNATIVATYVPGSGDTLTATNIQDYLHNNLSPAPTCTAVSPYTCTYTFTPSAPNAGARFFGYVTTTQYPAAPATWYIDIPVACPAGQSWNGSSCVVVSNPTCSLSSAAIAPGTSATLTYTTALSTVTSATMQYSFNGGAWTNTTAPSPADAPAGEGYSTGVLNTVGSYVYRATLTPGSNTCSGTVTVAVAPGSIDQGLIATPSRLQKSVPATVTFSYTTTGMTGGCSIDNGIGTVPSTDGPHSVPSTITISAPTTYTLSCTDGTNTLTSSATIGTIPVFQEI